MMAFSIENHPKAVVGAICVSLTIFMATHDLIKWLENKDASSNQYREFNELQRDRYPTLSVCFFTLSGKFLDKDYLQNVLGINNRNYYKALTGQAEQGFGNHSIFGIDFNDVSRNAQSSVTYSNTYVRYDNRSNSRTSWKTNKGNSVSPIMATSFRSPNRICLSRSTDFVPKQHRILDIIGFNCLPLGRSQNYTSMLLCIILGSY